MKLQQFDLGRLKVAESAMLFAAALRETARECAAYGADAFTPLADDDECSVNTDSICCKPRSENDIEAYRAVPKNQASYFTMADANAWIDEGLYIFFSFMLTFLKLHQVNKQKQA